MVDLLVPLNGAVVDLYTPLQATFLDKIRGQGTEEAIAWLATVKNGQECAFPQPVKLEWSNDGSGQYLLELSESQSFSVSYREQTTNTFCEITNLKIATTYYWRVNDSAIHSFTTNNRNYRFLSVDGLMNVRDLGGIAIKQGLLYRGSDLEGEYQLTEKGRKTFCEQLNIKTEIDLRKEHFGKTESAVGNNVRYSYLPYRPYKEIFEEEHRRGICRIMDFLADKSNYPVYLHCLGGADRTGMIAIFLRALVGEADEDIFTDYELTSLSAYAGGLTEGAGANGFRSRNSAYFKECLQLLDAYGAGEPLSVNVPRFLTDCGVTKDTLSKICEIIKV